VKITATILSLSRIQKFYLVDIPFAPSVKKVFNVNSAIPLKLLISHKI
jgi:hypothetical protein